MVPAADIFGNDYTRRVVILLLVFLGALPLLRLQGAYFAIATGLASGLYFMDVVIITPNSVFSISWAVVIVFVVVAGGMGTISGPLIGAALYIMVDRIVGAAAGHGQLVLGALSIFLMLVVPRGVMGVIQDFRQPARGRRRGSQWARWRSWLLGDNPKGIREALGDRPGNRCFNGQGLRS